MPNYLLAIVDDEKPDADDFEGPVTVITAAWPPDRSRHEKTWLLIRPDGYIAGIWLSADGARSYLRGRSRP